MAEGCYRCIPVVLRGAHFWAAPRTDADGSALPQVYVESRRAVLERALQVGPAPLLLARPACKCRPTQRPS